MATKYRLWKYRAWLRDAGGSPIEGIEEEIRARTIGEATCAAWGRAARHLQPNSGHACGESIHVEYVFPVIEEGAKQ